MSQLFNIILKIVVLFAAIPLALFIGKTTVNMDTWDISVEKPITAILFYATVIAALIESH